MKHPIPLLIRRCIYNSVGPSTSAQSPNHRHSVAQTCPVAPSSEHELDQLHDVSTFLKSPCKTGHGKQAAKCMSGSGGLRGEGLWTRISLLSCQICDRKGTVPVGICRRVERVRVCICCVWLIVKSAHRTIYANCSQPTTYAPPCTMSNIVTFKGNHPPSHSPRPSLHLLPPAYHDPACNPSLRYCLPALYEHSSTPTGWLACLSGLDA